MLISILAGQNRSMELIAACFEKWSEQIEEYSLIDSSRVQIQRTLAIAIFFLVNWILITEWFRRHQ